MTLRQRLGGDAHRIHELVDQLLDGDNSLIVLMDGRRAVSYGEGFGLSPCQLELVTNEIERALRTVGTAPIKSTQARRRRAGGSPDRGAADRERSQPALARNVLSQLGDGRARAVAAALSSASHGAAVACGTADCRRAAVARTMLAAVLMALASS